MGWTRRQYVEQAFSELGLHSHVFDLSPEMVQIAAYKLDAMMAAWYALGINVGYPLVSSPDSTDLETDTGIPGYASEAVYLNLAIRLAPGHGKQVPPQTMMQAKNALDALMLRAVSQPPQRQYPAGTPMGSGNKSTVDPFYAGTVDDLDSGPDGPLEF